MTSGERPGLPRRARLLLPVFLGLLVALSVHRLSRPAPSAPEQPPEQPPAPGPAGFPSPTPEQYQLEGEAFGTRYRVELALSEPPGPDAQRRIEETVEAVLDRVERAASSYREDSEINQLGRHRSPSAFRMSADLAPLMRAAQELSRQSDGLFDVTVRPLAEAWGLGPQGPRPEPDARRLTELLSKVGYTKLHVGDHLITKRHVDLAVDMSAIALGFAVDRLAEALSQAGFSSYRVQLGAHHYGLGHKSSGVPWVVAVAGRQVPLSNLSFATTERPSADPEAPFKLIDPRSGRLVRHELVAVSVAHPQAMVADAWATALAVAGPVEGPKLAKKRELAALFQVRDGAQGVRSIATAEFEAVARGDYIFDAADPAADVGPVPARDPGDVPGSDPDGT